MIAIIIIIFINIVIIINNNSKLINFSKRVNRAKIIPLFSLAGPKSLKE